MMDPAALGTLMIGLDSVRLENEASDGRRRTTRRTARRPSRTAIVVAACLRLVANRLDHQATQPAAG